MEKPAQARGATVCLERELAPVPPIAGRATELREALTNLIFNAVDALPQGGTITVRTGVMKDGPSQPDGKIAYVEVSDSGEGMTEETRRRCLEPFFTTKKARGTGLGLSMVYGTVQRHGGTMDVASTLGRGTTMRMAFPVAPLTPTLLPGEKRPGEGDHDAAIAPVVAQTALCVLVVDDEPEVRTLLEVLLASMGHTVDVAADGREGLTMFHAGRHDVVITDRAMPLVNGEEVAKQVKMASPSTPVIL
ncbi:MAG TPA: ATP-binding protein, partial [Chloroflexota bacterium]|nr:ATP-binding protein [Chloroflexota bacterium]